MDGMRARTRGQDVRELCRNWMKAVAQPEQVIATGEAVIGRDAQGVTPAKRTSFAASW